MSPAAFLYCIQPDGTPGERWTVSEKPLVVGRGETAEAFVDDPSLSRGHFLVVREASQFVLADLDSQNGTWVDGKRVRGCKLASGQMIRAGQSLFYFSEHEFGLVPPRIEIPLPVPGAKASALA
jgi:pSer/pThr/pTyr-binding forkhead associated (FHA) protein